jgi:arsenate reductase
MRKHKVLFVCIGNSCRSQMAEGFARTYGSDVLVVESAGLAPAPLVAPPTHEVMLDRNIDLSQQFPKDLSEVDLSSFDLVVNMSGYPFPGPLEAPIRDWKVPDPIGGEKDLHQQVAQQIESLVMQLILELRKKP